MIEALSLTCLGLCLGLVIGAALRKREVEDWMKMHDKAHEGWQEAIGIIRDIGVALAEKHDDEPRAMN